MTMTPPLDRDLRSMVHADLYRLGMGEGKLAFVRAVATERCFRMQLTFRLCHAVAECRSVFVAPVALVLRAAHALTSSIAGVDFPTQAEVGPGLRIFHGRGLVVSDLARIGADVTLFGGVTIGRRDQIAADGSRSELGAPQLGDRVWVGPNAIIVGPIVVGDGARIAGGAVVFDDVPPGSIVAGNPAMVIRADAPPDVYHPSQAPR